MLNKEEFLSNLSRFQINKHYLQLTHLFFTYDNLIFLKAGEKDIQAFKKVLNWYEEASGQMINMDKSSFMASRNLSRESKEACEKSLGIKRIESLGHY